MQKIKNRFSVIRVLGAFISLMLVGEVIAQSSRPLKLENRQLVFKLNDAGDFKIEDKKNKREWFSLPYVKVSFLGAELIGKDKIQMSLHDSTSRINFTGIVSLDSDSTISFLVNTSQKAGKIDRLIFPQPIATNYKEGSLVFCYRSGGVNISQKDLSFPAKRMMVYDNIGLDMPWIGVYDSVKGDGMMLLAETPYDVEMDFTEHQGTMWPNVGWAPSLREFSYERKVSFVFTSSGKYNTLAKAYRNYLKTTGDFKTLAEKAAEKPNVNKLKGSSIVWGSKGLKFAKEAHAVGIRNAIIMGQFKHDDIKAMTRMGYLNSNYENLEGTREGPMGFMKDTMAIAAYHTSVGKPIIGWTTREGVEYYSRSSGRALKAVPTYLPKFLKKVPLTGLFLDVTPAFIMEDFHPLHTFNRETDKDYKIKVKKYIGNDMGLVLGGEHGKAWNASILDYSEGTMSGSFFWDENNKPGYLEPPRDSTYRSVNFKKYGDNFRTRVPLWQLVFNDCVSSTWYWGDSNDWFYEVDPTISNERDNFNILYGTMPLMWADKKGYGWDRNRSRFIETIHNVSNFQKRVAFEELLSHQYLNPDRTLQLTKFKNGAQTIVNFSARTVTCKIKGKNITLAPQGFHATAPGFMQSKTEDDLGVVTTIKSDSLYSVTTDVLRTVGPITAQGKVLLFKVADKHWRLVTETPVSETKINLNEIVGNKRSSSISCAITQLDEEGKLLKKTGQQAQMGKISILPGAGIRLYDLKWN
jgi:hypothetical protein